MKKFAWFITGLIVLIVWIIFPASNDAQVVTAEDAPPVIQSIGAFANARGDAVGFHIYDRKVLSVYTDGTYYWYDEKVTSIEIMSLALTACGDQAFAFVISPYGDTEVLIFDLRADFPCTQPAVVYLPLVAK